MLGSLCFIQKTSQSIKNTLKRFIKYTSCLELFIHPVSDIKNETLKNSFTLLNINTEQGREARVDVPPPPKKTLFFSYLFFKLTLTITKLFLMV